ncbi:MAG TPA: hypothetical protein VKV95_13300 [Terriglobia bacterium]|nr:hypothetical protein [Terriglobia bacterium]
MDSDRIVIAAIKGIAWFAVVVLFLVFAYFTMVMAQFEFAGWARDAYYAQNPSTEDECKKIRPGMDIPQVLGVINRKAEPFEEKLKPDSFTFWRERQKCVVDLDAKTSRVVRAHLEDTEWWPPRVIE